MLGSHTRAGAASLKVVLALGMPAAGNMTGGSSTAAGKSNGGGGGTSNGGGAGTSNGGGGAGGMTGGTSGGAGSGMGGVAGAAGSTGDGCTPKPTGTFVVTGDVVFDEKTCLTWMKTTTSGDPYAAAETYCMGLTLGGYDDWRLPTAGEVVSIFRCDGMFPPTFDVFTVMATASGPPPSAAPSRATSPKCAAPASRAASITISAKSAARTPAVSAALPPCPTALTARRTTLSARTDSRQAHPL